VKAIQVPRRFVTHPWGGTETVVLETSKRLYANSHEAPIWTSLAMSDRRQEEIEGVPIRRFKHFYPYLGLNDDARRALDQKAGNLFSFELRSALMREKGLSILHAHTGKRMGGIVRSVAKARGIPYVVSLHGGLLDVPSEESRGWTEPTQGKFEWGKFLGAWVGARQVIDDADAVFCLGSAEVEAVKAKYPGVRAEILPNGVDPEAAVAADGLSWRRENGIPVDEPLALVVGRIDPQKGQLTAVQSLAKLAKGRLVLIGGITNDAYHKELQEAVGSLGLQDRVTIIAGYPRGDRRLWDAYAAADVVVLPSRHEPFGIVVLEAWAAGKPVVASAVGGLRDLIDDGVDGLLIPPGDPEALASSLNRLFHSQPDRLNIGGQGLRKMREKYTWDAITERLVGIYQGLIDERTVRP